MKKDILDIALEHGKKDEKKQSKTRIIKKIFFVLFPLLAPALVVYLLFLFTPNKSWFSFDGKAEEVYITDITSDSKMNINTDNLRISEGTLFNIEPILLKYNNTELTLEQQDLKIIYQKNNGIGIDFINPNVTFSNFVDVQIPWYGKLDKLHIAPADDPDGANVSQYNIYFYTDFNSLEKNSLVFDIDLGDLNTITLLDEKVEVYIKGELVRDVELLEIAKLNNTNPIFLLDIKSQLGTNIKYNLNDKYKFSFEGRNHHTTISTLDGTLNVIKTGEPKDFEMSNTNIDARNPELNYKSINTKVFLNSEDKTLKTNSYGEVHDLVIGGFSLFPNLSQWILNNISALVTTILTAVISGIFSVYAVRNGNE